MSPETRIQTTTRTILAIAVVIALVLLATLILVGLTIAGVIGWVWCLLPLGIAVFGGLAFVAVLGIGALFIMAAMSDDN